MVLTPEWMDRIDRLALKRFGQPGLAEEAAAYALERLTEDEWAICRHYSGLSRPEHYLLTVLNNLFEAFSRHRFGRLRPPVWMQREGELWVQIWKKICLERQPIPSVLDQLANTLTHTRDFLGNIVTVIKARLPMCGSSQREIAAENSDDANDYDDVVEHEEPPAQLQHQHLEETLFVLQQLFLADNCPSDRVMDNSVELCHLNAGQIEQLHTSLKLTAEERLLLKMVYQEGMKLKLVAKALGMPAYQPGRLLKAIHQRIHQAMVSSGFQPEILAEALN
jgi:hypothetical protein